MDKKELKRQVNEIFSAVSLLKVSGDAVDVIATVRAKLRKLYASIEKLEEPIGPSAPNGDPAESGAKETVNDGGQNNG